MEAFTEDDVERVIEWFEKDPGDALVGEEVLDVPLAELRALFAVPDDDPDMLDVYEVEPREVAALQPHVAHPIDLGAYDYFVAAYRKEG